MIQKEKVRDKLYENIFKNFDISLNILDRLYPNTERTTPTILVPINIGNKVKKKYKYIFRNFIISEEFLEFFSSQKPMDEEIKEIVNEHFEELL